MHHRAGQRIARNHRPAYPHRNEQAAARALKTKFVRMGDTVVITAGHSAWVSGTTNMLGVEILR